jgi:hypothetical protein
MADTHGSSTERPAMLSPTSSCSAAATGSREVGTGGLADRYTPMARRNRSRQGMSVTPNNQHCGS